jgi:hypothetical protein
VAPAPPSGGGFPLLGVIGGVLAAGALIAALSDDGSDSP